MAGRTLDHAKYPDEFRLLIDKALAAPVEIPHESPAGLRGYIQAYLRACEATGGEALREQAKRLQVVVPKGQPLVIVMNRSDGAYAKAVAAAVGTTVRDQASEAAAAFAAKLSTLQP